MKPYIVVIGSSNTDMVAKTDRLPAPGETVLGNGFIMAAGGKGANQAVAAARMGSHVVFIAKVGDDIFGKQAVASFKQESIDTRFIATDPENPSGVALITVDAKAENCIVVASGANANLLPDDIHKAEEKIRKASLILVQLEIPLQTVQYVAELAARHHIPLVLNPAPACDLPDELLRNIYLITPNQHEAERLTGIPIFDRTSAENAARVLADKGIKTVIITLGEKGALLLDSGEFHWVASPTVIPVDTTAAGDVFCGALVTAMSEGKPVKDAASFACVAAALSVTKMGAQSSVPTRKEVENLLEDYQLKD